MSLQLFPIFFKEFLADKNEAVIYRYKKTNVTMPVKDIVFDFRLQAQYEQLFTNIVVPTNPGVVPASQAQAAHVGPGNVASSNTCGPVKLFD